RAGQVGTAAVLTADIRDFMQRAVGALASEGQVRIERLLAGDRDVASAIMLRSGSTAWFWKIAYDEAAARTSPGVQVTLALTRRVLRDAGIARVDSCATKNHAMIDHLWRERLVLADHFASVGPAANGRFAIACTLEGLRRSMIDAAKWVRGMIRRSHGR
ncbi:MAG: GNAT family N-acetyltransferase, partial [Casimicrobiaceae bacterium]